MNYKLIASDLDGTLLNKGSISKENWSAIEKLTELGVIFVPSTGRAFMELPEEIRNSNLFRYYIVSSGASIFDKKLNKTYDFALPKEKAKQVLDKVFSYDVCTSIHADVSSYTDINFKDYNTYYSYNMSKNWADFYYNIIIAKENYKEFIYGLDEIQMVVPFFKNINELIACKEYFKKDKELDLANTAEFNLEICYYKAGKGNALKLLSKMLNIDIKNTIAVGDSTNDLSMIKVAGLSLAVENAVPKLKEAAQKTICNYKEHVAKYILENFIK